MGCVCVKQAHIRSYADSPDANGSNRTSTWSLVLACYKKPHTNHAQTPRAEHCYSQRIERKLKENISAASSVNEQKILERNLSFIPCNPSRHMQAEQVAAGWPDWLAAVAGEAINGWIPRRADSFERLYKIGQGTYSNVYKACDLYDGKIVALKMVRFDNLDPESVRFMAREIQILRRLDHPNVVKLEGLITSGISRSLYLVLEYMEHDLAGLASRRGIKFTEPQVKCYMQQLFRGLDYCHSHGVLHRDIKGSNLLIDNRGILKLADFGLATVFHPNQRQPLTSRVVTLWYRSPELLLGATEYGVAVDLWSTGCILAELLSGKPLMPGRTEVEQLHKIFKLCGSPSEEYWKKSKLPHATIFKPQQPYKRCIAETLKEAPSSTLALLETLLAIEPSDRETAAEALKSEFFTTVPFPCNPSSLPTYPPSKELDAKLHEEEARRKIAAYGRGHGLERIRRESKQSRTGPTLDDSIESTTSIQKSHLNSERDSKHRTKKFNTQHEGDTVGFPVYPLRPMQSSFEITAIPQAYTLLPGSSYSGPILCTELSNSAFGKQQKDDDAQLHPSLLSDFKTLGIYGQPPVADISEFSRLMEGRNYVGADSYKDQSVLQWNYADGLEDAENGKYEIPRAPDISIKQKCTRSQKPKSFKYPHRFQLRDNHGVDHRRDENFSRKESVMGYVGQEGKIHCSGPLLPPSANLNDILERHEQHLQRVVRRAQQGKDKAQRGKLCHTRKKAFEHKGQDSSAKANAESSDLKNHELDIVHGW